MGEAPPLQEHQWTKIFCDHCGNSFSVPVYCGNRFCEICTPRRLSRIRRRLNWLISQIKVSRGYSYKHLTLTIRSETSLSGMVASICKSFRRLRQRAIWKRNVRGGAFVIEFTKTENGFHAHLHIIIIAKYIEYFDLLKNWKKVSTGQGVYIQKIPVKQVVRYLTKYLSKPGQGIEDSQELSNEMKGVRMFSPFGNWYALNNQYVAPKCTCKQCGNDSFFALAYMDRVQCSLHNSNTS